MSISEANAKALLRLTMSKDGPVPRPADLAEALAALVQAGCKLDGTELAAEVMGSAPGGGLLHMVSWLMGTETMPATKACVVAQALLAAGAGVNCCLLGFRPIDMLASGVRNCPNQSPDLEQFVELLVQHGLDHEVPGKYSTEEILSFLANEGVPPRVLALVERGPERVALDHATCHAVAPRTRRTL